MNRIRQMWDNTAKILFRDPVVLSILFALLLFGVYSTVEESRAKNYLSRVEDYRESSRVQNLVSSIDQLAVLAEKGDTSSQCKLDTEKLFSLKHTRSYDAMKSIIVSSESLQGTEPQFSSAAVYLERARESRAVSRQIRDSIDDIALLAQKDSRSMYCSELAKVLINLSFMKELSTTAGVSALFVGQAENLQVNLRQTQEQFAAIRVVPSEFEQQHAAISNSLQNFAVLLRADRSDIVQFSEAITSEVAGIDSQLLAIYEKTSNMHDIPERLQLYSASLRLK